MPTLASCITRLRLAQGAAVIEVSPFLRDLVRELIAEVIQEAIEDLQTLPQLTRAV